MELDINSLFKNRTSLHGLKPGQMLYLRSMFPAMVYHADGMPMQTRNEYLHGWVMFLDFVDLSQRWVHSGAFFEDGFWHFGLKVLNKESKIRLLATTPETREIYTKEEHDILETNIPEWDVARKKAYKNEI